MELSILLAEQIFSLLLMVLTGYVVRKLNVVPKSGRKVFGFHCSLCVSAVYRICSFQIEYSSRNFLALWLDLQQLALHWRFLYGQLLCARRFFICQLQNRHRLLMRIQAI